MAAGLQGPQDHHHRLLLPRRSRRLRRHQRSAREEESFIMKASVTKSGKSKEGLGMVLEDK